MTRKAPHGCAGAADPGEVGDVQHGPSLLTEGDIYLFKEGNHFKLFDKLGAHAATVDGRDGTHFAVWAPNAGRVSVIGDFNGWDPVRHPLEARWDGSGIWEGFVPGLGKGALYKYSIASKFDGSVAEKADPLGFYSEAPPRSASVVWDLDYRWCDGERMAGRAPISPSGRPTPNASPSSAISTAGKPSATAWRPAGTAPASGRDSAA